MANKHTNLQDLFTEIADAIRSKNNSSSPIIADDFPKEIENLQSGFEYNNIDVTSIQEYAFENCQELEHVNCYNLTSVGSGAFKGCSNLKTVVLYNSVTEVGAEAFEGCDNVTVYCEAATKPEGWSAEWDYSRGSRINVVWGFAPIETWDVSETEEDDVIAKLYPDVYNDDGYFLIINGYGKIFWETDIYILFTEYRQGVNSAIISEGVTEIGDNAFYFCSSLQNVTIPDSVTSIGNNAFSGCSSLKEIVLPDSIISVGTSAFNRCYSLQKITIPHFIGSISDWMLQNCSSLKEIVIPDGVKYVWRGAFEDCSSLQSVTIPDSVIKIDMEVFHNCTSLQSIIYLGTISQWQSVTKHPAWDDNTPNCTIYCADGKIAKDGTVTMY